MSTNVNVIETTTKRHEHSTLDESDRNEPQFKVPTSYVNIQRQSEETLVTRLFSKCCQFLYTIKSFFTTSTTSSSTVVGGNDEEASWIEIVIIRRSVRIFR